MLPCSLLLSGRREEEMSHRLEGIRYSFLEGPVVSTNLNQLPKATNCQRLVQYAYFHLLNIALEPDRLLNPQSHQSLGDLIVTKEETNPWTKLRFADLVYARRREESKRVKEKYQKN
jgi:hypothetical protein